MKETEPGNAELLAKLRKDHDSIRRLAHGLKAAIEQRVGAEELEKARWALARVALPHLGFDDRYVLTPLEKSGGQSAEVARRFRADLEAFNVDFLSHMRDWTGSAVARSPDRYLASVDALVDRLQIRLEQEERELYPLILRLPPIKAGDPRRNWAADAWAIKDSISR